VEGPKKFLKGGGRKTIYQLRPRLSQVLTTKCMSFTRKNRLFGKNEPPPLNMPLPPPTHTRARTVEGSVARIDQSVIRVFSNIRECPAQTRDSRLLERCRYPKRATIDHPCIQSVIGLMWCSPELCGLGTHGLESRTRICGLFMRHGSVTITTQSSTECAITLFRMNISGYVYV